MGKSISKKKWAVVLGILALGLALAFYFSLPTPLFQVPYSVVLTETGHPNAVSPAADGQIRFPPQPGPVPERLAACIVAYEDKRFYTHPGLDARALARALRINLKAGRIRQGGSTLTMQVARMAGRRQGRSLWRKGLEVLQAVRLELAYSKPEILALWAAHAPFGGNTAGLEAAAWRYFGQPPAQLTWAEAATLAVLPNAPGIFHPGRGRKRLLARRNALLQKLANMGAIDSPTLAAACTERLPDRPLPLPNRARHLLAQAKQAHPQGGRFALTLSNPVQQAAEEALSQARPALMALEVGNAACIVSDNATGRLLAYVGNAADGSAAAPFVDAAQAPRSYGSLLKPFLYAHALEDGLITPDAWLEDVPRLYGRFAPRNFYDEYEGVVPASAALARSLNLPFVNLLDAYGQRRFCRQMRQAGLAHLNRPADDYGLALILGSGEATLWELARLYTHAAQTLQGQPQRFSVWQDSLPTSRTSNIQHPASIFCAFTALTNANRPELSPYYQQIARTLPLAWKTGTSHGLRDAWAIGCTPRHTIAIWCGNADGEGRPGLTGIHVAAPILFTIAARITPSGTPPFARPATGWQEISICLTTGHRAGPCCPTPTSHISHPASVFPPICPYHKPIFTDQTGTYQVEANCYPLRLAKKSAQLHLPGLQDYYARRRQALPPPLPWLPACRADRAPAQVRLLTPKAGAQITLPPGEGMTSHGRLILSALTTDPSQTLYWHLDGRTAGHTGGGSRQSLPVQLAKGPHHLIVIAEDGTAAEARFIIQ